MALNTFRITLLVAVITFGVTGCALRGVNLVKAGTVSVEKVPSKRFLVTKARVRQKGEELLISGVVEPKSPYLRTPQGHVDITIATTDGQVIEKVRPMRYLRSGGGLRPWIPSGFSARFPIVLSAGARIRVKHHMGLHPGGCPALDEGC